MTIHNNFIPPPIQLSHHSEEQFGLGGGLTRRNFIKRTGGATATTFIAWNHTARLKAEEEEGAKQEGSDNPVNISIWQEDNWPDNTIGQTTDGGPPRITKTIVPNPNNPHAYINGVPEIPNLYAKVNGADAGTNVCWEMELTSERANKRGQQDDRTYPPNGPKVLPENQAWHIQPEFGNEFNGGSAVVKFTCIINGQQISGERSFKIRGKNPLDADAAAHINATIQANANNQRFAAYALAIGRHESRQGQRVYNQFNSGGNLAELPNWGTPDGWGIYQIDRSGAGGNTSTQEVYNWKANVEAGFGILNDKATIANTILNGIARRYPNAGAPPNFQVGNVVFSAWDWIVIVAYNGLAGCGLTAVQDKFGQNKNMLSPIHYTPAGGWTGVHDNNNNYAAAIAAEIGPPPPAIQE